MPAATKTPKSNPLKQLTRLLDKGSMEDLRDFVESVYPAEMALLLESIPPEQRKIIWPLVPTYLMGEILVDLHIEVTKGLIKLSSEADLLNAVGNLQSDDLVDLLQVFPGNLVAEILASKNSEEKSHLESALSYDEDTAGGLMSSDIVTVRADVTLEVVLRYLRNRGNIPAATDILFVVDREKKFQGGLPIQALLIHHPKTLVSELIEDNVYAFNYHSSAHDVALLFEQRDILSAAVTLENGRLLGRITIDDVIDVIRGEADHSLMSMAGLDEEHDMFAPVITSAKYRTVWLGVNLLTALFASWVIGLYSATIEQIVALAILMPIVASMGGVAGSQTLTLVIRGLALQQIGDSNAGKLLIKEISVGAVNGLIWAVVVAFIAGIWFSSAGLGLLIGSAMVINLICAALAGASIPLLLNKIGIDPALAGGVLLTTVTDVVGFMAFLGLATTFML
jgi:magnesium transporter